MIFAMQAGDWGVLTIAVIVIGSVIGGMVKFYHAIQVLRKGKPEIDQAVLREQEQEFQNNEQND